MALIASLALGVLAAPHTASADIDVTGNWDVTIQHNSVGTANCTATLVENGTDLEADISCNTIGSGVIFGSFDKPTGGVDLFGTVGSYQMSLQGSATDDFEMTGTCALSPETGSCSFNGFRQILFVGGIAELPEGAASTAQGAAPDATNAWLIAGAAGAAIGFGALAAWALRRARD